MNKSKLRDILIIILFLILLYCIGSLGYRFYQYYQGTSTYHEAEALVDLPDFSEMEVKAEDSQIKTSEFSNPTTDTDSASLSVSESASAPDPYADALKNMDFTELRKVNSDILGWIVIPNTVVSYPLVQAADNDFYLYRTWKKSDSIVGSIFMDALCSPDLSDFHTLVYGHNMNNGSMFGTLKKFKTFEYWQTHPYFMISTDAGVYTYKIFSAFEANLTDPVFMVKINRDDEKQALIDCAVTKSAIAAGIVPTTEDQIVTLSTCTGRGHETRWIVLGILESFTEAESPEPSEMSEDAQAK